MAKQQVSLELSHRLINHGPTVLITSQAGGKPNVLTVAWITPASVDPPLAAACIATKHYSRELIAESGEFVINIPSRRLLRKVHQCGSVSGRTADKFREFGLTAKPALRVHTPVIEECIAHLECRVDRAFEVGDHTVFIGRVLSAGVDEGLFDEYWKFESEEDKTVHHLGSTKYTFPERRRDLDEISA